MQKSLIEKNPILKLSFDFSLMILKYCTILENQRKFIVARQLFRAATSIGANAMEAQNAESKQDFVHKMKLAAKEADETQYWLCLCRHAEDYPDCEYLLSSLEAIQKLLNKIISTTRAQINLE